MAASSSPTSTGWVLCDPLSTYMAPWASLLEMFCTATLHFLCPSFQQRLDYNAKPGRGQDVGGLDVVSVVHKMDYASGNLSDVEGDIFFKAGSSC